MQQNNTDFENLVHKLICRLGDDYFFCHYRKLLQCYAIFAKCFVIIFYVAKT